MELPTRSATSATPMTGSLWSGETPRYRISGHPTFPFRYAWLAATNADSVKRAFGEHSGADGLVLFLIDASLDAKTCERRAHEVSRALSTTRPVLVAAPHAAPRLGDALEELGCRGWVRENLPALEGDPVARLEAVAHIAAVGGRFERTAGRALGLFGHVLDPSALAWFFEGRKCTPHTMRPPRRSTEQRFNAREGARLSSRLGRELPRVAGATPGRGRPRGYATSRTRAWVRPHCSAEVVAAGRGNPATTRPHRFDRGLHSR